MDPIPISKYINYIYMNVFSYNNTEACCKSFRFFLQFTFLPYTDNNLVDFSNENEEQYTKMFEKYIAPEKKLRLGIKKQLAQ